MISGLVESNENSAKETHLLAVALVAAAGQGTVCR